MIDQQNKLVVPSPVNTHPTAVKAWAYRELNDVPVQEEDLIEQFNENLENLRQMQAKLQFMMREIRYLLKV